MDVVPAMQVFQDADAERVKHMTHFYESKYHFRPGARESNKQVTTWVDQDQSGDYDPAMGEGSVRIVDITEKRKRCALDHEQPRLPRPKKPKRHTWQSGRYTGEQLVIILKVCSDRGSVLLRDIGNASDNWPLYSSDTQVDELQTESRHDSGQASSTHQNLFSFEPHRLRKRPKHLFIDRFSYLNHRSISADLRLEDITIGHPAARGCKACFELGISCPLLIEGYKYPCNGCVEDDIECELILPPPKKRSCESCRQRKIVCSYREGKDHNLPCMQCTDKQLKCIAGPYDGRTRTGPSLDWDPSQKTILMPTLGRHFVTCTECRASKRWCSLKSSGSDPPCNHCQETRINCTFERLPSKTKKRKKSSKEKKPSHHKVRSLPPRNGVQFKMITTNFSHPISFNYQPLNPTQEYCDWCLKVAYGILGLGEVQVEVIDPGNGKGYTEFKGGHRGRGIQPSRMCLDCTFERLSIIGCRTHDVKPISGLDPRKFDFGAVYRCLIAPAAAAGGPPYIWCAVCPAPAFFACCKGEVSTTAAVAAADTVSSERSEASPAAWCGLCLCEACAVSLMEQHEGNLESLITAMQAEDGEAPFGLRADAEFLLPSGELLRQLTRCC